MSVLKYIPQIIPHSDETAEFITWIKIIGNVLVESEEQPFVFSIWTYSSPVHMQMSDKTSEQRTWMSKQNANIYFLLYMIWMVLPELQILTLIWASCSALWIHNIDTVWI